jgi:hypothetical protein
LTIKSDDEDEGIFAPVYHQYSLAEVIESQSQSWSSVGRLPETGLRHALPGEERTSNNTESDNTLDPKVNKCETRSRGNAVNGIKIMRCVQNYS